MREEPRNKKCLDRILEREAKGRGLEDKQRSDKAKGRRGHSIG